MELAIINGTYRDGSKIQPKLNQIIIPGNTPNNSLRSPPNPIGQPLIISPRLPNSVNQANQILNGGGQLIASSDPSGGLIYTAIPALYSDGTTINAQQTILDYPGGLDFSQAGEFKNEIYCLYAYN